VSIRISGLATTETAWKKLSGIKSESEYHVELCLFDMADPRASPRRKRRAREWLVFWAYQLEKEKVK
jgi:hypothetical protein